MKIKMTNNNALGLKVDDIDINPLMIAENHYFGKKYTTDYRRSALNCCINSAVAFQSTANNFWNITKLYIKTVCPYCGKDMSQATCQGGSSDAGTVKYSCSCGASISLRMPYEAISINPPNID